MAPAPVHVTECQHNSTGKHDTHTHTHTPVHYLIVLWHATVHVYCEKNIWSSCQSISSAFLDLRALFQRHIKFATSATCQAHQCFVAAALMLCCCCMLQPAWIELQATKRAQAFITIHIYTHTLTYICIMYVNEYCYLLVATKKKFWAKKLNFSSRKYLQ